MHIYNVLWTLPPYSCFFLLSDLFSSSSKIVWFLPSFLPSKNCISSVWQKTYLSYWACIISLHIIIFSSISFPENDIIFISLYYWIKFVYTRHIFFIHTSVNQHKDWLYDLPDMNGTILSKRTCRLFLENSYSTLYEWEASLIFLNVLSLSHTVNWKV